ncbi:MAG: hypothetical protein O9972_11980 [Burkholderiales bacterium]|nr:hypothetical protein [Burkholderiales bacterium]
MADAELQAVFDLFPESKALIARLADRSAQFHALCSDIQAVAVHLETLDHEDDRREYRRLLADLELELSEWIGPDQFDRKGRTTNG